MASSATEPIERPVTQPVRTAAGALLDRLFAPHGPSAYFQWVRPTDRRGADTEVRQDVDLDLTTQQPDGPGDAGAHDASARHRRSAGDSPRTQATRSTPGTAASTPGSRSAAVATGEVSFARSGLTAVAEGSLLETAEAAGLSPRNRCRRGICGTCTTPKLSGTVADLRTGETTDGAGPIRICVSVARGDVALDL